MGRSPCCAKEGLNRGAWTATEDKILTDYIKLHGEGKWRKLPKRAGLMRCGKSCRLRWLNYLSPNIKRGNITHDEEDLIIRLHKLLGNRWSLIAGRLPGRTDNEIKNYWNTNICKKMQVRPKSSTNPKSLNQQKSSPTIDADQKISPIIDEPKTNTESFSVVRTKASRCTTKPLITPEEAQETLQNSFFDRVVGCPDQPFNAMEDYDSFDFAIEFDQTDKKLLSDFLNSDFCAPLHGFENGLETGDPGSSSSPNSDQTLLFASDQMMLCDLDLQSMASDHLPDTSIYWLYDQYE